MDTSPSSIYSLFDELDKAQKPKRSPSRLDFCSEDLANTTSYGMDFDPTHFPYTFLDEELDDTHPLNVEPPNDADIHTHDNADTSLMPPVPPDFLVDQIVIEPRAPIPVRPASAQLQAEAQGSIPPSRATPQRLNYPHHGFSRSALLQQKTLWNSRHDEWVEWQSRLEQGEAHKQEYTDDDAYAGLTTTPTRIFESPPCMRTPPSGLERDVVDHPGTREQDMHSSIHPRVGDISALRDPYSVNIDRCFFRYPLWTLQKTLYVFNMHQRSGTLAPSTSSSWSSLSSYPSSASTDDEGLDSTLVGDDNQAANGQTPLEPSNGTSSHSPLSWSRLCGWELSWYARWELLISLFQRDRPKCDTVDASTTFTAPPGPTPSSSSSPIIPVQDIGDDEEDYGTVISNTGSGVAFEEECERAMLFYRGSNRLEMQSRYTV